MVSQASFDSFWGWFGKNLQKLRYQRHVCSMWQSGLIYGFISRFQVNTLGLIIRALADVKRQVDEALKNEEAGTFLIRFSERHAGLFAVGYKIDDSVSIVLYCVDSVANSNLSGPRQARTTLPSAPGRHCRCQENSS